MQCKYAWRMLSRSRNIPWSVCELLCLRAVIADAQRDGEFGQHHAPWVILHKFFGRALRIVAPGVLQIRTAAQLWERYDYRSLMRLTMCSYMEHRDPQLVVPEDDECEGRI